MTTQQSQQQQHGRPPHDDDASVISLPSRVASSYGRSYLVSFARSSVLSLFSRLSVGLLTIKDVDGNAYYYGDQSLRSSAAAASSSSSTSSPPPLPTSLLAPAALHATLHVKQDAFWIRMFFGADLGFSEAYMADEVDTPDLGSCFDVSRPSG